MYQIFPGVVVHLVDLYGALHAFHAPTAEEAVGNGSVYIIKAHPHYPVFRKTANFEPIPASKCPVVVSSLHRLPDEMQVRLRHQGFDGWKLNQETVEEVGKWYVANHAQA